MPEASGSTAWPAWSSFRKLTTGCSPGHRVHNSQGARHGVEGEARAWVEARLALRLFLEEGQDLAPGVLAGLFVLVEGAVEEGVRRTLVDDHPVCLAGVGELPVELLELLLRGDVGARDQHQERRLHLRHDVADASGDPVEADRPGQAVSRRGLA